MSIGLIIAAVLVFMFPAYHKLVQLDVSSGLALGLLLAAVSLALLPLWIASSLWYSTAELRLEGGNLIYRALGRRKSWPMNATKRLVRGKILVQNLKAASYLDEELLFLDSSNRCFLRLGPTWPHSRIAHAIGLPIDPTPMEVVTATDAARTYPGSYSWLVAHPLRRYFLALGLGAVGFAVFVLILAIRG